MAESKTTPIRFEFTGKKRWSISIGINFFNFCFPKIQKIRGYKDFNGRSINSNELLAGPFSFAIHWRMEDQYDKK